jgi:nucleotide-binding universal stress UspA family protein
VERTRHREHAKDRHILIAVDESENARRAVQYVAGLLGGVAGFRATLLSIIPEPSEDYFAADADRKEWMEKYRARVLAILEECRGMLVDSGFGEDRVEVMVDSMYSPSAAECIINEQKKLGCSTIVVGRRGISKKEESLFGSTSDKILHEAKDCAVWVIE